MPILSGDEMLPTVFEPILSHRFVMYIDSVASYCIKSVDGLGWDDGEYVIDHINSYYKGRAKRRYSDITLGLYDPVAPSGAQMVEQWGLLAFENLSGRGGYGDVYWKDITMNVIGPSGDIVREWILKKAFIKTAKYGTYDYSTEVYTQIDLTLTHSGLILNF